MYGQDTIGTVISNRRVISKAGRIHVLVADATRLGNQLLEDALKRSRYGIQVAASAVTRAEVFSALSARPIDVAVLSENLESSPCKGFEILREMHALYPNTRPVMLLHSPSPDLVVEAFRLGAKGVFSREASCDLLCKCIYVVQKGQIWANSHELQYLLAALAKLSPPRLTAADGGHLLGRREDEVADLVAEGMTNREIAKKLHLSEHTVSNYLFHIYEKLGISSRVELVLYVLRHRQPAI